MHSDNVLNDPRGVGRLLAALAPGVNLRRVIDRDDRTDEEIKTLQQQGVRVLNRRHIESYLLDDDILTRLCGDLGDVSVVPQLLSAKTKALASSIAAGGPADDFKRIAGDIYLVIKNLFKDKKLGNDQRAFMRGFCAPLIKSGTAVYQELLREIFGD